MKDEFTDKDKREVQFHNFDENPEVIGILKRIENGTFGEQLVIGNDKGEITIGSYGVLKSKIGINDIGKKVKIVFKGNIVSPKSKRTYKDFNVFVK